VRLTFQVGEQLVALAGLQPFLLLQNLDVRLQARQRSAELVGRIRDEPPLGIDRLLECPEHRVEGGAQPGELVASPSIRDTFTRVAGSGNSLRRAGQAPDGYES